MGLYLDRSLVIVGVKLFNSSAGLPDWWNLPKRIRPWFLLRRKDELNHILMTLSLNLPIYLSFDLSLCLLLSLSRTHTHFSGLLSFTHTNSLTCALSLSHTHPHTRSHYRRSKKELWKNRASATYSLRVNFKLVRCKPHFQISTTKLKKDILCFLCHTANIFLEKS